MALESVTGFLGYDYFRLAPKRTPVLVNDGFRHMYAELDLLNPILTNVNQLINILEVLNKTVVQRGS